MILKINNSICDWNTTIYDGFCEISETLKNPVFRTSKLWALGSNPNGITIETKNIRSSVELLIFFIHFEAIRRISNPVKNPQKSRFFTQKIPQKFLSKFQVDFTLHHRISIQTHFDSTSRIES